MTRTKRTAWQGKRKYIDREEHETILISLTRGITVVQVLWFSINCIGRLIQRMALTTLELTTLAFIFSMLATSVCWRHKPLDVAYPIILETNNTIAEILKKVSSLNAPFHRRRLTELLAQAGPAAQYPYRRTPLDFVSRNEWFISRLWAHYIQLLRKMHIGMFSRPLKIRPVDRIPSDNWPEVSATDHGFLSCSVLFGYAAIFLCGWNLSFPTEIERTLWRATSIYNMVYMWLGSAVLGWYQRVFLPRQSSHDLPTEKAEKATRTRNTNWYRKVISWMRNNSPDHDPAMETPLRMLIPASILCILYCLSRMYILVEDFIGLRQLPSSAFNTVNWSGFLPHF